MLWWSHRRCTSGCHQLVDGRTNQLKNLRIGDQSALNILRKIEAVDDSCEVGYGAGTG
jgi:hypothetical protein